jgi:hypothetical protein
MITLRHHLPPCRIYGSKVLNQRVMGRRPCAFTEADIKRALRAIRAAGETPGRIVVGKDGGFTIEIVADKTKVAARVINEWDEDE